MVGVAAIPDLETALAVVEDVYQDPHRARSRAEALIARNQIDAETEAVSWWALGLAARQLNDLAPAESSLRTAIEIAEGAGLERRVGQIRSSLALVLLYTGDSQAALNEAKKAATGLTGADRARNDMQIGLILQRLGRLEEALTIYRTALTGLRRAGDRIGETRLLINRGVLHGYRGELDLGVSDLEAADKIARNLHQDLLVAASSHNLGFLEGRRGDLPAALAWFDRTAEAYEDLGRPPGMMEVLIANRGELLLSAGLISEAEAAVETAITGLQRSGNLTDLSETRLLAAEVALAAGKHDEALAAASAASVEFEEQDRETWRLLADYAALRARFLGGPIDDTTAHDASRLAHKLMSIGLHSECQHCHILAGRIALRSNDLADARRHLEAAAGVRVRGTALDRAKAWHAEALLRQAEGNLKGSARAIDAGLRVIRDYRLSLGAAELRSHAAAHGLDLALLALEQAMASGSAWRVLKAVESWRAESTRVAAARPPSDPELTHLLAELRRVGAEIREAALAGEDTGPMFNEERRLETTIRSVSRRLRGGGQVRPSLEMRQPDVFAALGDRRLISYFNFDGAVHAISVHQREVTLRRLVETQTARDEISPLLFALNRLAVDSGSARAQDTAADRVEESLAILRHWLFDPFSIGGEPIVVVPTAALHRLPWPALDPGLAVSVSPSLESWMVAASQAAGFDADVTATLVAGPDLPGATEEVSRISRIYRNRRRRTGRRAVADKVLEDIQGAAVAHIAAHGVFRSDNPSFSSLRLHDGPLTVYDFEQIEEPPSVMVLSSCDTAVTKVVTGDELLGLSSALIGVGVSNLIAPVVPIRDDLAGDLMVALHRHLVSGVSAAEALARVIADSDVDEAAERALRSSFVVFGA